MIRDLILVWTYLLRNVLDGFIIMAVSENVLMQTRMADFIKQYLLGCHPTCKLSLNVSMWYMTTT